MFAKKVAIIPRGQRGATLVGTVVALALLGIIGGAFLSGLATSSRTAAQIDKMATLDNLARAQMEYAKNSAYIPGSPDVLNYPLIDDPGNPDAIDLPAGYSVNVHAHELQYPPLRGIQEITVTVSYGNDSRVVHGYKVNLFGIN